MKSLALFCVESIKVKCMKSLALFLWSKKYEISGFVCVASIKVKSIKSLALFVWCLLR